MDFIDLKTQYRQLKGDIDRRIQAVLDHGAYIMGPEVGELEERLAAYTGSKYCIGVASGTDALLMAMMALEIGAGDEVITTPFTFIATGEMIALLGARPIFVDIDPITCNLDPNLIKQAITSRTKAIMPVSLYGQCAEMDEINSIAAEHGLPVIEDAAQSFGAIYKNQKSCALSTIGCTSFFPSKPLGCYGDGGACFTDDEMLARKLRQIRVHGQDRRYHHALLGVNGRLDSIQAAVLLAKLDSFPAEVRARSQVANRYSTLLAGSTDRVTPVAVLPGNASVYAQYTVQLNDRDAVAGRLQRAQIPTAVHYPIPLHLQPAFGFCRHSPGDFPRAESAAARVLSLPMHPYLDETTQEQIVATLVAAL